MNYLFITYLKKLTLLLTGKCHIPKAKYIKLNIEYKTLND